MHAHNLDIIPLTVVVMYNLHNRLSLLPEFGLFLCYSYNLLQVNVGSIVYAPYIIDRPSLLIATRQDLLR